MTETRTAYAVTPEKGARRRKLRYWLGEAFLHAKDAKAHWTDETFIVRHVTEAIRYYGLVLAELNGGGEE